MIHSLRQQHIGKLLLGVLLIALPAQADKRKAVAARPMANVAAEPALPTLTHQEEERLSSVEDVLVFDSLVVRKADLLSALPLPAEAGRLEWIDADDPEKGTRFINGFGDACYEGLATDTRHSMAMKKHLRLGNEWSEGERLFATEEADSTSATCQSYAYLLSDGSTLYLAQQASDGLGGLDIYMTTMGAEGRTFYRPENVGMPFNSTANDYLMIINEEAGVGYFASDRGQSADSVCVYYFRPNAMRKFYSPELHSARERLAAGRLTSIASTWREAGEATRCREEFEAYRKQYEASRLAALDADPNAAARRSLEEQERTLQNLRKQWHEGHHSERLRELIIDLEEKVIQQRKALRK